MGIWKMIGFSFLWSTLPEVEHNKTRGHSQCEGDSVLLLGQALALQEVVEAGLLPQLLAWRGLQVSAVPLLCIHLQQRLCHLQMTFP